MLMKQLFDMSTCTYTYLLAKDYGREAVIIDPVKQQMPLYLRLLDELNLTLVAAIDTHLHADHITALGLLREHSGCDTVMGEQTKADPVSVRIKDGESISFDDLKLTAIHTPGHTSDSYSFFIDDKLFTGDTLFIRGTGRTDFQNGDAFEQYNSIFNKLFKLPEHTRVYPGHDYSGQTSSTLWEEKCFNPRLQVASAEDYARLMNNLNLPDPKHMSVAVPANLHCGLE